MNLYQNSFDSEQQANIDAFRALMKDYPSITFFHPSPEKAPWHIQCRLEALDLPIVLNFWPHVGKAQREGCKSVATWAEAYALIDEALIDAAEEPFDVIEG